MTERPTTIGAVLDAAADFLSRQQASEPRLAAEWLMGRLLGCGRLDLQVRAATSLTEKQLDAMRRGTRRVANGEPIQYVVGQWDFYGRTFKTDKRALIPRPETEGLAGAVLSHAPLWALPRPVVVDVGTGSGCIAITLAIERPAGLYIGLDVSADALALARENATLHGIADRIGFSEAPLCDVIEPESVDAIVSNPPYVPTAQWETLPPHIRNHEPRLALDGGPDGLGIVEAIVQDASMALKPGGALFMEIGEDQGGAVSSLFLGSGFTDVEIRPDLAGKSRFACGRLEG